MNFVIYPAVESERLERIKAAAEPFRVVNALDEAAACAAIRDAHAFFGKVTPALLADAAELRWVQSPTASLEHYMFPALVEHPCILTNMRGLFSDVIADQVMCYILCFARNLHHYIRNQSTGRWAPVGGENARVSFAAGPGTVNAIDLRHQHLADATLGVVGLGSIGSEIARRALAFQMKVVAVDPYQTATMAGVSGPWPMDRLSDLMSDSDYVVIAAPHTPETYKLFRRPLLEQMKRSAYLINIGRGAIVDLADLTAVLAEGRIAGAALDVFEIEPLPQDHPLWKLENVIITPHIAGYSPRIAGRHVATLLENIRRFKAGEPLLNVVDKKRWF